MFQIHFRQLPPLQFDLPHDDCAVMNRWMNTLPEFIQQSATDFATVNEKDFRNCGFQRVWNPLAAG